MKLDARGRSCPEPVLMASTAFEDGEACETFVDSRVVQENVARVMKQKFSCKTAVKVTDEGYGIHVYK